MKNIPNKIYLQIGEDADLAEDFKELSEEDIAWSTDRIFDNDIEYIRAGRTRDYEIAIERIRAGEDVDTVLTDYGWEGSRWIPCKERLPKMKDGSYGFVYCIVARKNKRATEAMYNTKTQKFLYTNFLNMESVTDWMPLPEPPKETE